MYEWFFDDYAAFVKTDYERAIAAADPVEKILITGKVIARYYYLHTDAFLFFLVRVYGNQDREGPVAALAKRGIDVKKLHFPDCLDFPGAEKGAAYPPLVQLVFVTLMFWVAVNYKSRFEAAIRELNHSNGVPELTPLSEEEADKLAAEVEKIILNGLVFNEDRVNTLNYGELEKRITEIIPENFEDDGLYRAVAEAVAEAGPWNVSMDMVARRSGLSKSGLYSHFKSRQDMLRRFFQTEFERITISVDAGKARSTIPEEQLYLAIIAIADYLRAKPEILLAFDRIRTRKLNLGFPEPPRFYRVFSGINAGIFGADCSGTESVQTWEYISQWILFLIINMLMRWSGKGQLPNRNTRKQGAEKMGSPDYRSLFMEVKNSGFRILYRFIVLGIRGFTESSVPAQVVSFERGVDL
jgi:AcrR family transcriptional regulator